MAQAGWEMDAALLAPRPCFKALDPALEAAADLLSEAADALLAGDSETARRRLQAADMPALWTHANDLMGRRHANVLRYRAVAELAEKLAKDARHTLRAPSASVQMAVFRRDGFRCRYCGCRVVLGAARRAMNALAPDAVRWGAKDREQHAAFYALTAVADHIVPHSRGGTSDADNLVTTCQGCNYGKEDDLIEHLGLLDPRERPPVRDDWDGLSRMLAAKIPARVPRAAAAGGARAASPRAKPRRVKETEMWSAGIDRSCPRQAERLRDYLRSVAHLGVSTREAKCLLVCTTVGAAPLAVLGIEPDGTVQIPWEIGDEKARFKRFAVTLAAGIPGAEVYETPRMWRVRLHGRMVTLGEVMDASTALTAAFEALAAA